MQFSALLIATVIAAGTGSSEKTALTPQLKKTIEGVSRAYFKGDSVLAWKLLAPIVEQGKKEQIEAIDKVLTARKIPPVDQLLTKTRLILVEQNLLKVLPRPKRYERLLILKALRDLVKEIKKEVHRDPIVTGSAKSPKSLKEYEKRLWDLHVLQNKMLTARRFADYAEQLSRRFSSRDRKKLEKSQRELLASISDGIVDSVARYQQSLKELEVEVHLERLLLGVKVLERPKLTKARFQAAYTTGIDTRIVKDFFQKSNTLKKGKKPAKSNPSPEKEAPVVSLRPRLNRFGIQEKFTAQAETSQGIGR